MLAVYGVLLLVLTFHLLHILSQRSPSNEVLTILPLTFSCLWVSEWVCVCVHACTHVYVHTPWCIYGDQKISPYFLFCLGQSHVGSPLHAPGYLAHNLLGFPLSILLRSAGTTLTHDHAWLFLPGFWISKFWSSRLHDMKHQDKKSNMSIS